MREESREQKLARRAIDAGILAKRAAYWAKRYRGCVDEGDLVSSGNAALPRIVAKYEDAIGGFEDYCRRLVDCALLSAIRVEARRLRIDKAAQLAAADLLALRRSTPAGSAEEPGATPRDRARALARALAAATFAAMTEEAQRRGEEDLVAREDFATALTVIGSVLEALTKPQRQLFALVYGEGRTFTEARKVLKYHYNTVLNWHDKVLAEIRKQLEKRGIDHAPGRGGAPRVALAVLRSEAVNDDGEEGDGEEGDGEDGAGR